MILYHTSDREIRNPDIHYGRKNADFGWGFYLTPDREFTYRWARENAVVNVYELDENELNMHTFTRDIHWFEYIFNNRRLRDSLVADVVIGPIANDTIFDTLGIMSSGFLKPEAAVRLSFHPIRKDRKNGRGSTADGTGSVSESICAGV